MLLLLFEVQYSAPSRRFKYIEEQLRLLSEKSELKLPAGRDDEISGLLEDLREIINDYKVRS